MGDRIRYVVISWDDWGGWYDHETPPILDGEQGDYQYGFRVPLIVVSAFTPRHYIDNEQPHDFGSILRFIQGVFDLGEGIAWICRRTCHWRLGRLF